MWIFYWLFNTCGASRAFDKAVISVRFEAPRRTKPYDLGCLSTAWETKAMNRVFVCLKRYSSLCIGGLYMAAKMGQGGTKCREMVSNGYAKGSSDYFICTSRSRK